MIREHEDLKVDVKKIVDRCITARCNNTADPENEKSIHGNTSFDSENAVAQKRKKKWP